MQILRTFQDPHYEARYTLGGRVYVFAFAHNARLDRWYVTIRTESGGLVAPNRKLVVGVDLLAGVTSAAKPPGALLVVPMSRGLDSPRMADIGEEYALIYLDS